VCHSPLIVAVAVDDQIVITSSEVGTCVRTMVVLEYHGTMCRWYVYVHGIAR
jgi:hypothetical protein